MTEPAAIVLAGGRSTRMGRDKASLVVNGTTMLDHVLAVLAGAGVVDVVVAGPSGLPDPQLHQGPLAGIVSGWKDLATRGPDPVVVLSCDLPGLTSQVVSDLLAAGRRSSYGAVAHDGERAQPLVAAYRPVALAEMCRRYEYGERSAWVCVASLPIDEVPLPPAAIADADTPADLDGYDVEWDDGRNPERNTDVAG